MNKKRAYTLEEKKKARNILIAFLIGAALLVGLDALSKWLVQINLKYEGNSVEVIPNFFYITLSHNTGSAFGLGQGTMASRIVFILISLIMSGVIIFYWVKAHKEFNKFEHSIAALLAAGAVGNLIDRALYFPEIVGFDGVIDFFQFYLGGGRGAKVSFLNPFASFNPADAFLVVGCIMLIVYIIVINVKAVRAKSVKSLNSSKNLEEEVEIVEEIVEIQEETEEKKDDEANRS